jgi:hypothetical protein
LQVNVLISNRDNLPGIKVAGNFGYFYFVDIFPTEHALFVKPVLIDGSYH